MTRARRAFARAHPWRIWALFAGLGLALFLATSAAVGRLGLALDEPRDFRLAIVHWLLAGYLPGATRAVTRSAARARAEIAALAPLAAAERLARVFAAVPGDSARRAASAGVGIAATLGAILWADAGTALASFDPSAWSPEVWWQRGLEPWIGAWGGLFIAQMVAGSDRVSRAAALLGPVDLLDRSPFAPFTRFGLRNALLAAGMLSLLALLALERGLAVVAIAFVTLSGVTGLTGLLLPMRGARARIVEAKATELAAVEMEIRGARARPSAGGRDALPGRLADLLAWRDAVRRVPEWPFDSPTLARFAFYLVLPVGSWLGGALVEHVVSRMLD